jgi:hypothetical protein
MPRELSKEVKHRFVQAVQTVSKELYPKYKEVDIIKAIGMHPTNYYTMRIEDNRYPTIDNCVLLCTLYNISGNWLLTNRGSMKTIEKTNTAIDLLKEAMRLLENKKK